VTLAEVRALRAAWSSEQIAIDAFLLWSKPFSFVHWMIAQSLAWSTELDLFRGKKIPHCQWSCFSTKSGHIASVTCCRLQVILGKSGVRCADSSDYSVYLW